MTQPLTGHDGPYPAPLILEGETVRPEWIDYNGHMNVAYYSLAFDHAIDRLLEDVLGVGETHVAAAGQGPYSLQNHLHYLAELHEGDAFDFAAQMIDCDTKRMHVMLEMRCRGTVAATCEQVLMNVDLNTRRSAPYPDWAVTRMAALREAHLQVPRPAQFGRPLTLERRGWGDG